MPLVGYHLIGFDREPLSYSRTDHRLLQDPAHRERVEAFFSRTPHRFNLMFLNCLDQDKPWLWGTVTEAGLGWVLNRVGEVGLGESYRDHRVFRLIRPDAVNFLFINNYTGEPKIPFTPWMIAHRMGHTPILHTQDPRIVSTLLFWNHKILLSCYGYDMAKVRRVLDQYSRVKQDDMWFHGMNPRFSRSPQLRIFHGLYIGMTTSRSARTGVLHYGEYVAEWLAQYLRFGAPRLELPPVIKYNVLPPHYVNEKVIQTPDRWFMIEDPASEKRLTTMFANVLQAKFQGILEGWVGRLVLT